MKQNNLILAVNGTLMRGLELENNLKNVNATFISESKTEKAYRLFSINDQYPAMVKVDEGGNTVDVELYAISEEGIKEVLSKEPPGLTIKEITLIDGQKVQGVIGLPEITKGQKEITTYGGWRNYLKSKKENKMKKLFLYYSYTGNGDLVSKEMEKRGFELRKIDTVKRLPKSFFWSMMVGGFQAGLSLKSKLKEYDHNIEEYEQIVIGSPIWNGKFPPAINTVLKTLPLKDKNISFLFYSGSGEGAKALKRIKKEYPNAQYVFLQEPKKHPDELNKINY